MKEYGDLHECGILSQKKFPSRLDDVRDNKSAHLIKFCGIPNVIDMKITGVFVHTVMWLTMLLYCVFLNIPEILSNEI